MGFPIKTSDNDWLKRTVELFEKRISISITDDAGYNFNINHDVLKLFKRFTLSKTFIMFISVFYLLAIGCFILLLYSFSLQYAKALGVTLAIILLFVCLGIPSYYLVKNKPPKVEQAENCISIKFNNNLEENL
jgi:hypothetical protein